jgi:hypothetical protein
VNFGGKFWNFEVNFGGKFWNFEVNFCGKFWNILVFFCCGKFWENVSNKGGHDNGQTGRRQFQPMEIPGDSSTKGK